MKRLFVLLLCLCTLLVGCGQTVPVDTDPGEPPMPVAEYQWGDYVNICMPLPDGWEWEPTEMSDGDGEPPYYVGFNFWKTDIPDLCFTFECWPQGFGMCATGVKFTEVNGKYDLTLAEEQGIGVVAVTILFNDVPGSYVIGGSIPNDLWAQYRDEVVKLVDDATVAEGCMARDEAVEIAIEKCVWLPDYVDIYGDYNATEGVWQLHFATDQPDGLDCWVWVTADGEIANQSYDAEGNVPLVWNDANLSPTPKVGENS